MWDLYYDGGAHQLYLYPYTATGSTEIGTGANSVPVNTWVQVEVQYTATATGGARLFLNGQTQANWGVTGNYTRATNLQRLQLWDDGNMTTDFDQVTVAAPPGTATLPGAPTNVNGTAGNASVALDLDGARLGRREPDHRLPHHAVHRSGRPDAGPHRICGHEFQRHGPHQRHDVHLHGRGDQRRRSRPRLCGITSADARCHADGAWRAHGRGRRRGGSLGRPQLDCTCL